MIDKRGRCFKCNNPFQNHHIINEFEGKVYHTGCLKKLKNMPNKTKQDKVIEELRKEIGQVPDDGAFLMEDMQTGDKTCVMCGHPANPNKAIENLLDKFRLSLSKAIKEREEEIIKIIEGEMFKFAGKGGYDTDIMRCPTCGKCDNYVGIKQIWYHGRINMKWWYDFLFKKHFIKRYNKALRKIILAINNQ